MKKMIRNTPVTAYSSDGVYEAGDILWFKQVRDEADPDKIHKGVYGQVVRVEESVDMGVVIVSFREHVDENGKKDPGYQERRFQSKPAGD